MAWQYSNPGEYLAWAQKCFALTRAGKRIKTDWAGEMLDLAAWRKEFVLALHKRINLKSAEPQRWRKLDPYYQTELKRDQWAIERLRERVLIYRFSTPELNNRLGHLLAEREA